MNDAKLYQGDCLDVMKDISDQSYEQLMFPTIERLAEIFMVSKAQMRLRLQQMGLEVCDE